MYKLCHFNQHNKSVHALTTSRKPYIDFDIDISNETYRENVYYHVRNGLFEVFGSHNSGFIIQTSGGFHVLVKKEFLKFNPQKYIDYITEKAEGTTWIKEIIKNDNLFIPIPGTFQYEKPVIIRNKEDFLSYKG